MYIKIKIIDASLKSLVLPLPNGSSSHLKVVDGTKLEVTPLQFSEIVQACQGSKKVVIQEIDVKEFKDVKAPVVEPAKEALKETKETK